MPNQIFETNLDQMSKNTADVLILFDAPSNAYDPTCSTPPALFVKTKF